MYNPACYVTMIIMSLSHIMTICITVPTAKEGGRGNYVSSCGVYNDNVIVY